MKKKGSKKKVLVIVAHPDDETIWMGGTLLMNKDKWNVTIISLCRRDDPDRAPKFKKVCKIYNAKCFMSDLEDEKLQSEEVDEAIKRIKSFIDDKWYDCLFTHGSNGEYGHQRHKDVHKAVVKMLKLGDLKAKKVFFFNYKISRAICIARRNSDKFIKMRGVYLMKKRYLIEGVYGFNRDSFEYICSKDLENFKINKKT